jgi:16S rRNA (guanine966-N2)-methyltransferase
MQGMGYKRRFGLPNSRAGDGEHRGFMRVIAGTWGGRKLAAVPGRGTRPTSDRVREAIFSRLESRYLLSGARILDLYAGTGALGIEALSRGAAGIVSVEKSRRAARVLMQNIDSCKAADQSEVRIGDVARAIAELEAAGSRFDGVFIDPPYEKGLGADTLASIGGSGMITVGGWVVAETARGEELATKIGAMDKVREDLYGDTKVTLYEFHQSGG